MLLVDLYYRSLVKQTDKSHLSGEALQELHIQLPQKVTDSYKLVYISHPAREDSDSGEHSPADSKGADIHPEPALRKAHSLEHVDIEARRDPASREHSPAK